MMGGSSRDWRVIALGAGAGGTAFLAFLVAASMLAFGILASDRGVIAHDSQEPLKFVLLGSASALIGALSLMAAYYCIQRLRGRTIEVASSSPLGAWKGLSLAACWFFSAWLAQWLFAGPWKLLSAVFYLSSLGIPVYLLIRVTTGGLPRSSPVRFWGIFTTGMVLSAALAILVEVLLLVLVLAIVVIYLMAHPDQWTRFQHLTTQLAGASSAEQVLQAFSPSLAQPWVFAAALVIFSGFTPLIEETAKSAAAWLLCDRLVGPAQGFLAGAVSGAGFGLLESLLAGITPGPDWAITLLVRGGSTMMHVMSGAIAGWGIGSYRGGKRLQLLLLGFAAAFLLHAIWNASVLAVAFGAGHMTLDPRSSGLLDVIFVIGGGSVLGGLCLAIPTTLFGANRRLRLSDSGPAQADATSAGNHGLGPDVQA